MDLLFDALPYLSNYKISFLVINLLLAITLIQNVLTAPLAFIKEEQIPGMPLRKDHSALSFRVLRTYGNSTETVPVFCVSLLVAILAGASSAWVNGLAIVFLLSRLAFWGIYYSGLGIVAGGPRTLVFVVGLFANFVLVATAMWSMV